MGIVVVVTLLIAGLNEVLGGSLFPTIKSAVGPQKQSIAKLYIELELKSDPTADSVISDKWIDPVEIEVLTEDGEVTTTKEANRNGPLTLSKDTLKKGMRVRVRESNGDVFRQWYNSSTAFITNNDWKINEIPELSAFTEDEEGTIAGDHFFDGFLGSISELPEGSFNTDNLVTAKTSVFRSFASRSKLTSLPAGSFNLKNVDTVGDFFFDSFARE